VAVQAMMTSIRTFVTDADAYYDADAAFYSASNPSPTVEYDMGTVSIETDWGNSYHRLRRASALM
jgi:hypothetical protein